MGGAGGVIHISKMHLIRFKAELGNGSNNFFERI
jgi:hypothetical protein